MGYRVKLLKGKSRTWKVQYETYIGGRQAKDIHISQYESLGISDSMTIEEVRCLCRSLNSQEQLKRIQEKRNNINNRIKEEQLVLNSMLPDFFVQEFEKMYVSNWSKKHKSHWRIAKKLIVELQLNIDDWAFNKEMFYRVFRENTYSYSYIQKLLFILNSWGKFIAYKRKCYFEPIPAPKGRDKEKIIDLYDDNKGSNASSPITINQLEKNINNLCIENYNWIYLSIWLGLRPIEVDNLKKPESRTTWFIEEHNGIPVLWVYQSKLTGISREKRLKPIPLKYTEQQKCLEIIKSKKIKRPLNKTIQKYFTFDTTCYGGRKGFTDLMLERGNTLESISQWMGHKNINRTWKDYKDKNKVLF
jgi:integrase